MKLLLPYPISVNRYWRNFRGRMTVSAEAKTFKQQVRLMANIAGCQLLFCNVHSIVTLHPRLNVDGSTSKVVIDLDNAFKVMHDALNGIAWVDDKQIKRIWAEYGEPCHGGAMSVEIRAMA